LALVGDSAEDATEIAEILDEVLQNSFLRRRLAHRTAAQQAQLEATIQSRAQYIWGTTTAKQRRSWHLAGLGLENGLKFADCADELYEHLLRAEEGLETSNTDAVIEFVLEFAEIAWGLHPFTPQRTHPKAAEILEGWLLSESVAELSKHGEGVGEFIEDAIVYRLTWAIEAARIWANTQSEEDAFTVPSPIVSCVEHGTINKVALVFLGAGLRSRRAAEIVAALARAVSDRRTLRRWLKQPDVQEMGRDGSFPTVETHLQWCQFVDSVLSPDNAVAHKRSITLSPAWNSDIEEPSCCLARSLGDGRWFLYSDDLRLIGEAASQEEHDEGLFWTCEIDHDSEIVAFQWRHP
jgi:hypothetical protein